MRERKSAEARKKADLRRSERWKGEAALSKGPRPRRSAAGPVPQRVYTYLLGLQYDNSFYDVTTLQFITKIL